MRDVDGSQLIARGDARGGLVGGTANVSNDEELFEVVKASALDEIPELLRS